MPKTTKPSLSGDMEHKGGPRRRQLPGRTTLLLIGLCILFFVVGGVAFYRRHLQVHTLILAAGAKSGDYYPFGVALASVVEQTYPRIHVHVVETEGSVQNVEMLQGGKADLGIAQTDVSTGPQVRTVALLYPELYQLVVRADSGITKPVELKGKTIVVPPEGSGSYESFQFLMQHYGLSADSVKVVRSQNIAAAFLNGQADAAFSVGSLGQPVLQEILKTGKGQLIALDQIAAMQVPRPYLLDLKVPVGTYRAADPAVPDSNIDTVGVDSVLYVNANVDPGVVNSVTRVLFERRNALISQDRLAAYITSPVTSLIAGPLVDPGAQEYYDRTQPNLVERYYDQLTLLALSGPVWLTLFLGFRVRLRRRQRRHVSQYNESVLSLLVKAEGAMDLAGIQSTERELTRLLRDVMTDLENNIVSLDDLTSFSFVWDKTIDSVRHRATILANLCRGQDDGCQLGPGPEQQMEQPSIQGADSPR